MSLMSRVPDSHSSCLCIHTAAASYRAQHARPRVSHTTCTRGRALNRCHACRRIAGLELFILNGTPGWRGGMTGARSMDLDDLRASGGAGPDSPAGKSPPTSSAGGAGGRAGGSGNGAVGADARARRAQAVTQSMPAFNRDALTKLRISSASGIKPQRSRAHLMALHGPPVSGGDSSAGGRPRTGAPRRMRSGMQGTNPRAPGSLQLLDCLLAPEVRHRLSAADSQDQQMATPPLADPDAAEASDSIKAIKAPYGSAAAPGGTAPVVVSAYEDAPASDADDDIVEMGSSIGSGVQNPTQRAAIQELKAEVRNARFAGRPGADSDQIRLARLELKLKTLQVCILLCAVLQNQQPCNTASAPAVAAVAAIHIDWQDGGICSLV